ncbi:uncharacterized protein LOC135960505 [Calliphora vicina]|uniref:uncharacterized protein LOC135960505 n=1 Tax=Calliphora vicina TaxID=7373 RepID=UPI00325B2E29
MISLKYCIVFVAVFATTALAVNSSWGKRNATDILLLNEAIVRTPVANTYLQADVVYPKSGQTNNRTITAIFIYDRFTNTSGATGSLWSGGPGYKFATVNLKSQYGKGINTTVEIWGK